MKRQAKLPDGLAARFTVRLERGSRRYVRCLLFANREAMYVYWKAQLATGAFGQVAARKRRCDFVAQTSMWLTVNVPPRGARRRARRIDNCVGQVLFDITCVGSGLVAHEMTHVALGYCDLVRTLLQRRRKPFDPVHAERDEEWCARVAGDAVSGFWRAWWRRHLDRVARRCYRQAA
jgi:hypothetical protein